MKLNESEQDRLQILVKDDFLMAVVEKLFIDLLEEHRPDITEAVNNETLGEKYRAYQEARKLTNECFKKLREYKRGDKEDKETKFSRGR